MPKNLVNVQKQTVYEGAPTNQPKQQVSSIKKQPPQQILRLQKNQIKEVPGAFNNMSAVK